jgi:hypothetical protein
LQSLCNNQIETSILVTNDVNLRGINGIDSKDYDLSIDTDIDTKGVIYTGNKNHFKSIYRSILSLHHFSIDLPIEVWVSTDDYTLCMYLSIYLMMSIFYVCIYLSIYLCIYLSIYLLI